MQFSLYSRFTNTVVKAGWFVLILVPGVLLAPSLASAQPTAAPTETEIQTDSDSDSARSAQQQARAEQFVDLLFVEQNYEAAWELVHPTLQAELSPERIQQKLATFQEDTGPFVARLNTEVNEQLVLVSIQFEQTERTLVIIFDDDLLITGVDFFAGAL